MMKPERWKVRSLRRFRDHEVLLYLYLGIGGIFSLIYFVSASINTQFYKFFLMPAAWAENGLVVKVSAHLIWHAMLRVIFWLPDIFWKVLLGGTSFMDWMLATHIVKELM